MTGCTHSTASTGPRPGGNDPLTGGSSILGTPTPLASTGTIPPPTPASATAAVPALPVTGGTQSPAILAGGGLPLRDPSPDLRIAGPSGGSWGQAKAPPAPAPETAAVVQPVSRQATPVARGVAPSAYHVSTYEQALAFLKARGVKWYRLETWGDNNGIKFSCSIPNPKNQYISRNYEAQAVDGLAAMQAVIDQIEQEGSASF